EIRFQLNRWIEGPYRWSHHPSCSNFFGHTVKFLGREVCRGCLFWWPGIVAGIILGLVLQVHAVNEITLASTMIALVSPTLLSAVWIISRKVKDVSRGLLGIDTGFAVDIVVFPGHNVLLVRIIVLIAFLTIFLVLTRSRNQKNESICAVCPELPMRGSAQCSGYKALRIRRAIADTQLQFGITDAREVKTASFDEI
ncbi:MAG TPA: hypothetical protein VJ044_14215, partial [Candidatus Hodarchaeales archaeon]|nr:hypothetical protein [Candidatus Hodarchaeales archaeon]